MAHADVPFGAAEMHQRVEMRLGRQQAVGSRIDQNYPRHGNGSALLETGGAKAMLDVVVRFNWAS